MSKKQLLIDYKILNSRSGRNILADLRKRCPIFDTGLNPLNGIDTNMLCFLEGQRETILYIFKMLDTDPYEERQRKAITENRQKGE